MQVGDRISITFMGFYEETLEYTVEEFRHCLGIFENEDHRKAGKFTPLCVLYKRGEDSEDRYIPNYGNYATNMVPAFVKIEK